MSTDLSNYNIFIYKGNTFKLDFKYTDKLNLGIDLSNYTAKMEIRRSKYRDRLLAEVIENYPAGCFGRGVNEDFTRGNGILGYTGGIILNYEGINGNIHLEIDTETTFALPVGKHLYDFQLVENSTGIQRTILRGNLEVLPVTTKIPRLAPEFVLEPGLTVEYGTGYGDQGDGPDETNQTFSGSISWGTDEPSGIQVGEIEQGQYFYVNSDVQYADGIDYQYYIDYLVDEGELVYFADLTYEIEHRNYNYYNYNSNPDIQTNQTDIYIWRIGSSIPIEHGRFLDNTPWVVDNGDLYLISVTPEKYEITTAQGTGLVASTVINPDFGKMQVDFDFSSIDFPYQALCKKRIHVTQSSNEPVLSNNPEAPCNSPNTGCGTYCPMIHPFDYRGGVTAIPLESPTDEIGNAYDPSQAWNGTAVKLETGDMIVTQTPFTGDFQPFDGVPDPDSNISDMAFTESYGCFSVVSESPPINAFRPPINWDITDKQNRPILTEEDTFDDDLFSYPNYTLSSNDPVDWGSELVTFSDSLLERPGTICPAIHNNRTSPVRGSLKVQANIGREYGGYQAKLEEDMIISCFDSNVSQENRTKLRRIVAQRGIDTYGAIRSLGKNIEGSGGGHHNEYAPRTYFAWSVTNNSDIYDCLNGIVGNTANGSYKVFDPDLKNDGYGNENIFDELNQSHIGLEYCSFRHFNLPIVSIEQTPGRQGIKVERPLSMEFYYDNPSAGPAQLHLNRVQADPAGRSWGWSDNHNILGKEIVSAYIRTKTNSNPQEITRIVDINIELGDAIDFEPEPGQNPQFVTFYLQEDILTGNETHIDLCSYLEETKNTNLTRTITRSVRNTSSESGVYAYSYSVIKNALSNHLIAKAKGGRSNLPYYGKDAWDKSLYFFTTMAGKELFLSNINSAYNYRSDLHHALCRQEIANGLLLDQTPTEKGNKYIAENYYSLPATKTWPELQYPPGIIKYWSREIASTNSGRNFWNYSDNRLAFTPNRSFSYYDSSRGIVIQIRSTDSFSNPLRWGDIKDLHLYSWSGGFIKPVRFILNSTTATSDDNLNWTSEYIIQDSTLKRIGASVGSTSSLFFLDPIIGET